MSALLNRAFNQVELNKIMKQAKKSTFFYGVGIGFLNGYMLLSDNKQVQNFVQNEFMFAQDMFYHYGKNRPELKNMFVETKTDFEKNCLIHANITPFLHQNSTDVFNKRVYRVFNGCNGNFIIDTKFLNVIRDPFSDQVIYSTDEKMQKLLIRDSRDGEFVAGILGIRSDDEQRALLNSIDDMEV